MADETLEKIVQELELYFSPLIVSAKDSEVMFEFFSNIGWRLGGQLGSSENNFLDYLSVIAVAIEEIVELAENPPDDIAGLLPMIREIQPLLNAIIQLPNSLSSIPVAELSELPKDIFLHLTKLYIFNKSPLAYRLLELLTIIRRKEIDVVTHDGVAIRALDNATTLDFGRVGDLFSDPVDVFESTYWPDGFTDLETTNAVAKRLFTPIGEFLMTLGVVAFYGRGEGPSELSAEEEARLDSFITLFKTFSLSDSGEEVTFGSTVGLVPENEGGPGAIVLPFGSLEIFEPIAEWGLSIEVDAAAGGIQITGDGFSFVDGSGAGVGGTLRLEKLNTPEGIAVLLGEVDGTHLEIGSFAIQGGFELYDDRQDVGLFTELQVMKLVIKGGEGDGFISSILSEDGLVLESSLQVGYSKKSGFHITGSGGLEIFLPARISLGPIELQGLTVALKFTDQGEFPLELGANIGANLGPLQAVVENIGLRLTLSFPETEEGNLGVANLDFGFKPPNGVSLSIDAGAVSGGGYLYFDFYKEEYAGVLELDLSGIVSVTAVGLITTRMPDGSKGFSLLLIITAEFGSPIQLGLGFTLSGVGGLLGLNRTMRLEEIAKGIRDGGINSIMFPQNVVSNAPKIISDLKTYFPVEEGTFLIGPMVKIGWGTPNLVTVSLGVIIEIPGNIAILGVLKVALPDERSALIVIQVNFMGAIEFDKERLWFFASLYESRVLFITLEGDMGLLVGWGDNANFVVSVGGFHPAFNPPALPFGEVRRISVSILNTDYARIIVQGYFAVTSNSVQFGAGVEIFFGVDAFNIDGYLAFDALFRFSPFYFIISISASLSVKVFGIGLFSVKMRGSLEGPSPWHVEGEGSISLLFFDISVDFSHTWGQEEDTELPPVEVMPILEAEYQKLENWRAVLSSNNNLSVTLRSFEQGTADLILHPVGSLQVSQRAVPLGVTIDKLGNQVPNDVKYFAISVETVGIDEQGEINESFARGQFFEESDNKLLDAPSFEPMQGGIELSVEGESKRAPQAVKRVVRYEKIIIDTHYKRFVARFYAIVGGLFDVFLGGNAMALSPVSWKTKKQMQPFADKVNVGSANYDVANIEDNTAYADNTVNFTSYTAAQEYLNSQAVNNPNLKQQLHVIPSVELQKAA